MKKSRLKRFLSLGMATLMLISLVPTAVFAARPAEEYKFYAFHFDVDSDSSIPELEEMFPLPQKGTLVPGEEFTVSPPDETTYLSKESNTFYELSSIEVKAYKNISDSTRAKTEPETIKTFYPPFEEPMTFIAPLDIENRLSKPMISLIYYWNVIKLDDPDDPSAGISNPIGNLNRKVTQGSQEIQAVPGDSGDIYNVYNTQNIMLSYAPELDMTKMKVAGQPAWSYLEQHYEKVTDRTEVTLTFKFTDAIDVAKSDFEDLSLDSDMFVYSRHKVEGQTLTVTCNWSSELAEKNGLNPKIVLNGMKLKVKENWNGDTSLIVASSGSIDGEVWANLSGQQKLAPITGGSKSDLFTLQLQQKISDPGMDKAIVLPDGTMVDKDTVAAGDKVDFVLNSTVPENLKKLITYEPSEGPNAVGTASGEYRLTFHDQMADALIDPSNFQVKIGNTPLEEEQYTLTRKIADGYDFELALDLVKLYNDGVITDADLGVTPITVTYTATLEEGTTAGDYQNTAWVSWPESQSEKDIVTVETCKLNVFKYDRATKAALEGATFELTTEDGTSIGTLTTGADGFAVFDGLDAGTYYLTETSAPDGYVCSGDPIEIVILEDLNDNTYTVKVANSSIPSTGGMGTTLFTIGGAAIIVGAGIVLAVTRKRKKAND